jgi:hypothetical protein
MTVVVTHTTPADSTFSSTGAAAWSADHALSGVGTMAEQNANNVAITGGTINNTTIGATTPSTGVFTTLTATGQTTLGGDVVITNTPLVFKNASNNEAFRINTSGSNYWQVFGAATPVLRTNGGATNAKIGMGGAFPLSFVTNSIGTEAEQLRIAHTASAVNYVQVTGGATGVTPAISFQGSDGNIGGSFVAKGSNGTFRFLTNTTLEQLRILNTASAVNYATITGSAASSGVVFSAAGTDTNIDLNLTTKGTGSFVVNTGNGIGFKVYDGSGGAAQVNYFQTRGRGTGSGPFFLTDGNDTNVSANLGTKGTGVFSFLTSGASLEQFRIAHIASAVNYVQVVGSVTGGSTVISSQGSDANISITIASKGAGDARLQSNSTGYVSLLPDGGLTAFRAAPRAASGDTFMEVQRNVGFVDVIAASGVSNGDIRLTPKGTGNVRFGTYTASMALTIQGYIEVKDSGGTIRKLAVIA